MVVVVYIMPKKGPCMRHTNEKEDIESENKQKLHLKGRVAATKQRCANRSLGSLSKGTQDNASAQLWRAVIKDLFQRAVPNKRGQKFLVMKAEWPLSC